ncbi:MAG TPA: agmatinase [Acholeplasmataceae bacterium]|nr:agmatinase [Acholeplasmataceae bacterium]
MIYKTVEIPFQSCVSDYKQSDVVIFSCPMDSTTSFRPGTRFAGNAIRIDSIGLEWYSPYFDMSLREVKTCDIGDLDLPIGKVDKSLKIIEDVSTKIINDNKQIMMVGGEHLVTLGVIRSLVKKYPDLHIIHLDAHTDLRDEFFGMKLSHATVLRRCYDLVGDNKIFQFGIRSGDKEEFVWSKGKTELRKFDLEGLKETVSKLKNVPVYITIDLDVLDPAYFPGTGTPEPGGITFKELLTAVKDFDSLGNIVGADIVELSPHYDNSGSSTAAACKILREMVLLLHRHKK